MARMLDLAIGWIGTRCNSHCSAPNRLRPKSVFDLEENNTLDTVVASGALVLEKQQNEQSSQFGSEPKLNKDLRLGSHLGAKS